MSFYRKYRPQNFDELIGQDPIRNTLVNAVKLDRVNHAYLFTGPRGTGKTSAARILAKTINCTDLKDYTPCEKCDICKDIRDGRLIDLIEIDAASNRGIDEIRDLREKINFAPTRAKNKVYIIDEVHMLTKEAFNALLKTLEEPPEHVYFILATTEVHKIPETILSRCQRFDFKRISEKIIVDHLKFIAKEEAIEAEDKALELISHNAEGGLRDAIGLFEKLIKDKKVTFDHVCTVLGISGFASIENLYGFLEKGDIKSALKEIQNLYNDGFDLVHFNKNFLEYLRKKMLESVESSDSQKTTWILKLIDNFQGSYNQARFSTIAELPIEIAIVESCYGEPIAKADKKNDVKQENLKAASQAEREHKNLHVSSQAHTSNTSPIQATSARAEGSLKNPLEIELKKKWDQILEKIKVPAAKRAFSQAQLLKVEGNTITLCFATNFYRGKMLETTNKHEVEKTIDELLGKSIKIVAALHTPKSTEKESGRSHADKHAPEQLEEKVLEVFGGEII